MFTSINLQLYHTARNTPQSTVFAVGMALERNPTACQAMISATPKWEIASHGYRWWDYQNVDEETEREHIARTVQIHKNIFGERPVGMYQGKPNVNTRRLVVEEGGFLYDSDSYSDDLPYWSHEFDKPHLVVPYTLAENDMRFAIPNGFSHGGEFAKYLKDSLSYLVDEGKRGKPKMMSVGLHCRLVGRPGRAKGLEEFIDFAKSFGDDVWICRRDEIALHWYKNHHPAGPKKSSL
jgi:allantoinase